MIKRISLFVLGLALVTTGIALVLVFWPDVIIVFKGAGGMLLALIGLIVLVMAGG